MILPREPDYSYAKASDYVWKYFFGFNNHSNFDNVETFRAKFFAGSKSDWAFLLKRMSEYSAIEITEELESAC